MSFKQKFVQLFTALIVVASLLAPAALYASPHSANLQPLLVQLAVDNPGQRVRIIAQAASHEAPLKKMVVEMGGQVVHDLAILNAISAEMTASLALQLARSPSVRWVSLDGIVESTSKPAPKNSQGSFSSNENYYLDTLGVREVWAMGFQGQGVTVAVIDSGISQEKDLDDNTSRGRAASRVREQLTFNPDASTVSDQHGHGTHVAGIVGGDGSKSAGAFAGVAPGVDLISLKIGDDEGNAFESDTVAAMQWVLEHKSEYNIRVVNLSINSTAEQSYHTSPLDAAAEILWFNGIVVVASSGNMEPAGEYNTIDAAPANDPFIITVGATNENGTAHRGDDSIANFTNFGTTAAGFSKPEILAPGKDIISLLASPQWVNDHPDRMVGGHYFRLSGTSMSAPMVAGAAALLLQAEPHLTPDQVKYRLVHTGSLMDSTRSPQGEAHPYGYAYLDVHAALTTPTTESANTGIQASQLLWSGDQPITWDSVNWNSVNWNSVNWNAVNWNAVNWNSVNWNSVNWN